MRTYPGFTDERGSKRAAIKARPDAREPGPSAAARRADPSARSRSNEASRPSLPVVALPVLARLAFHPGDGAARDGHPLAPHGVARVLDVEEPSPTPGPAATTPGAHALTLGVFDGVHRGHRGRLDGGGGGPARPPLRAARPDRPRRGARPHDRLPDDQPRPQPRPRASRRRRLGLAHRGRRPPTSRTRPRSSSATWT